MESIGSADRLAALSGLAPVPRDSGRISGNLHRPRRYDRRLMRVFYLSAQFSTRSSPKIECLLSAQTSSVGAELVVAAS
ncbi:transposase [Rhodococcoides fascians]|uniref:transposase n=1 Tax=Rhodococcoides fascians TaxID=1828 RepID=UPI001F4CE71A|nr:MULTISPECIES: transposase [Rhodococcus]